MEDEKPEGACDPHHFDLDGVLCVFHSGKMGFSGVWCKHFHKVNGGNGLWLLPKNTHFAKAWCAVVCETLPFFNTFDFLAISFAPNGLRKK